MAWQFHQPETCEGFVQAFRREKCIFEVGRLPLNGLDPHARYAVRDLDTDQPQEISGRELTTKGLSVTIPEKPGAVVIGYKRLP